MSPTSPARVSRASIVSASSDSGSVGQKRAATANTRRPSAAMRSTVSSTAARLSGVPPSGPRLSWHNGRTCSGAPLVKER